MEFVKIKYTDLYETIEINIEKFNFVKTFKRNEWTWVPKNVAIKLLENNAYFVSEHDIIFRPDLLKEANLKIAFKRFGAYGDLIQLIPIVKFLKRTTNNKYYLITDTCYVDDFKQYGVFDDVYKQTISRKLFDKIIFLDGVLENDHSLTNHERYLHRIQILEDFLNIRLDYYDYNVKILDSDLFYVDKLLKNAILQQN